MENAPTPLWWRNPTIIAAIIAAIAAIAVAFIGLMPKPKPSEIKPSGTIIINQQTSGENSPAIGQTGGNLTITNGQPSTPEK